PARLSLPPTPRHGPRKNATRMLPVVQCAFATLDVFSRPAPGEATKPRLSPAQYLAGITHAIERGQSSGGTRMTSWQMRHLKRRARTSLPILGSDPINTSLRPHLGQFGSSWFSWL